MDVKGLIKLEEVKAQLNLMDDFDLDDDLLKGYIVASLEVAQNHIGKTFGDETTESTVEFTQGIKVGCLMYIAHLYANREITTDAQQSIIPMSIESLWNVYREPSIF